MKPSNNLEHLGEKAALLVSVLATVGCYNREYIGDTGEWTGEDTAEGADAGQDGNGSDCEGGGEGAEGGQGEGEEGDDCELDEDCNPAEDIICGEGYECAPAEILCKTVGYNGQCVDLLTATQPEIHSADELYLYSDGKPVDLRQTNQPEGLNMTVLDETHQGKPLGLSVAQETNGNFEGVHLDLPTFTASFGEGAYVTGPQVGVDDFEYDKNGVTYAGREMTLGLTNTNGFPYETLFEILANSTQEGVKLWRAHTSGVLLEQ